MIVNEATAKTMWCPLATAMVNGAAVNRLDVTGAIPPECRCLGTMCMLWIIPAGNNPDNVGYCGFTKT